MIYIHGYRNSTEDANRRAVAIQAAALGNRPVVSIVWPSYDQTTKYFWDEANNEWAREHLRETIVAVARLHRKTDIIAHSMGNRILLDVLSSLGGESVVNNVIMAAPDVDRDLLQHLLARPQGLGAKTTVYASLKDQALASSWRMHGHPRAGDLARGAGSDQPATDLYLKVNRADIVDTSAVRPTFVGHADFIETIQGAKDLCLTINANDSEPLGTREPSAATNHWVLRVSPTPSPNCDPAADQAVKIANGK